MSYRFHSIIKAIVIPAVYFPHYEIYVNIFNVAIITVSEKKKRKHKNNSLSIEQSSLELSSQMDLALNSIFIT